MVDAFLLSFSFGAGAATFVNPCGFALLPAYVSYYVGAGTNPPKSVTTGIFQGFGVGILATLGFILVFGVGGMLISYLGTPLVRFVPWIAVFMGALLSVIGSVMLLGRSIPLSLPLQGLRIKPSNKGPKAFFLFGIAYALASLSCTIPVFLLVVVQALSAGGFTSGVAIFLSYALGMGSIMILLSVTTGTSRGAVAKYLIRALPYTGRVSGGIILVAGLYLIYFHFVVGRLLA